MDRISATIITRNEEAQIERCLNSLNGVADEIIIVDSFSTDRTLEICKRYGCKITQRAFTGFGFQRQYAVGLAQHNFILALDADEVLSEDLRKQLLKMKQKGFEHRIYNIPVVNYFCGNAIHHSGWQAKADIRLFSKRYANWNLDELGECVTFDPLLIPHPIPSGQIDHYRVNSGEEFNRKERRRSSLQARILARDKRHIAWHIPYLNAIKDLLECYIGQQAFLDGKTGAKIALCRFVSTFTAYRIARNLLHKRPRK